MSKRSKRNKGCVGISGWRWELEQARRKWLHRQVRFFDVDYSQEWQQGEVMEVTTDGDVVVVYSPGPGVYCGIAATLARAESILTVVEWLQASVMGVNVTHSAQKGGQWQAVREQKGR